MTLANTSRTALAYVEEVTPGVTPTAGDHIALRFTGESFDDTRTKQSSDEIRDDRQRSGMTTVSVDPRGAFNLEFSYREYDPFLRGLLQGDWLDTNATVVATFTTSKLTASAGTPFANVQAGQWVKISGAVNAKNNGWKKVVSKTDIALTFAAGSCVAEADTASVGIKSSRLSNGATPRTFSIERQHQDVGEFFMYRGLLPAKLSLKADSTSKLTGSFDFVGFNSDSAGSTQFAGVKTPSQTYQITNGVKSIKDLSEGGLPLECKIKSLDFSVDNAPSTATAIGELGNADVSANTLAITVTLEAYFNAGAAALKTKYDNDTETSMGFRIEDVDGNGYALTLPNGQISKFKVNAGQINQYCMASIEFTAYMDAVTGKTIFIDRCGA